MRPPASILIAALLLPQLATAQSFGSARDIIINATFNLPRVVLVELDPETRVIPGAAFRIVTVEGRAVAYGRINDRTNHMPRALFDAIPIAADITPPTSIDMALDNSISTSFQPKTAETYKFRFHFSEFVAPTMFEYAMESGIIADVKVRSGPSFSQLEDNFVGTPSGSNIELSGERARAFEIVFTVRQGVPRFAEMKLFEDRSRLFFWADPSQRYSLLYGPLQQVSNPRDTTLTDRDALTAQLGPERVLSQAELGDHDGITEGDNCPAHWNLQQEDGDKDGVGDACDNCPHHANAEQVDTDRNGMGDVCDDFDKDGVANAQDNCPMVKNFAQQDEDQDGQGNACDNEDNRFTAGKPWILTASFIMIILFLAGIGYAILRRTST